MSLHDQIGEHLKAAVRGLQSGKTIQLFGKTWAASPLHYGTRDGSVELRLMPVFDAPTADKPAGGAPLELEGLKFTTVASGVTWQHKGPVYLLTWAAARRLSDWLCVEVDKRRAPVGSTLQYTGVTPKEQARQIGLKNRRDDLSPEALTAAVWSGEGPPPVGCACEYQRNDVTYKQKWVEVAILYVGETITVMRHSPSGNEFTEMTSSCVFRPLRTAEQLAAEAREAAILQLIADAGRPVTDLTRVQAAKLYDAGYRKEDV